MRWRRKWQPTPVFLPGESQGWGSLVGCRLWGRTELDMTEVTAAAAAAAATATADQKRFVAMGLFLAVSLKSYGNYTLER